MPVEVHEVVFSFDRPSSMRSPLLLALRQLINRSAAENSKATSLLSSQRVLIVDSDEARGQYIASQLASDGYTPFIVPNPLEAYTIFLQGSFLPCSVVLSEESSAHNQFFLTRLAQQFLQQYDWKLPFIRLRMQQSGGPDRRSTDPLTDHKNPSSGTPLSLSGELDVSSSPLRQSGLRRSSTDLPASANPSIRQHSPYNLPLQTSGDPRIRSDSLPSLSPRENVQPQSAPLPQIPGQPSEVPFSEPSSRKRPVSGVFEHPLVSVTPPPQQRSPAPPTDKISLNNLNIGRYQLRSIIGGNPLGDVYLTYDRLREQDIVLKTVQTNRIPSHLMETHDKRYNLFQPELDLLQKMKNPYFAPVMNVGESYISGYPFIYKTMPYYAAGSLHRWIYQSTIKTFPLLEVAYVISQLSASVQLLHDHGRLHQNFKMTNVLLAREATYMRELQCILSDLAFVQDVINLPKSSEAYRYFAPEQWDGEAFTSSDQYGLAVIAYELLAGRPPFQGNSSAMMRRLHLTMAAPPPSTFNSQVNGNVDRVLLHALSKRPEERFESVSAFAFALERASR